MDFEIIAEKIAGVPHTGPKKGKILYDTILENGYARCLELGFAHGVGSCYMAGALAQIEGGKLTSVDNSSAKNRTPNIFQLLERCGVTEQVEPVFHPSGYNWFLLEHLEKNGDSFDFCFLDGAHTWEVDGLAFFAVASLLRPGGLIILDDLDWSYNTSPTLKEKPAIKALSEQERETKQVRALFELLVKRDPRFECWEKNGWGYARKVQPAG